MMTHRNGTTDRKRKVDLKRNLVAWSLPLFALQFVGMALLACDKDATAAAKEPSATAKVKGFTDPALTGTVTFTATAGGALHVRGTIAGLKFGSMYAIHVHEKGNCSTPDSAGGHFHTGLETHGNPYGSEGTHHDGDLPNLQVDSLGTGHFDLVTTSLQVTAGPLNAVGRSVIVHAGPDDYSTPPSGNSGARIGCGVIVAD